MELLAPVRFRVFVGASAAAVLGLGLALRPPQPSPAPIVDETPAPILQQVVQQREAENIYRRMREGAPAVARFTARLSMRPAPAFPDEWGPPAPPPPGDRYGVIIGRRQILGAAGDLPAGTPLDVLTGDGRIVEARVASRFAGHDLALLEAGADLQPVDTPVATRPSEPGSPLFGTAPWTTGAVVAPIFVAAVSENELLTTSMLERLDGLPVFNMDGELAGIVAGGAGRPRVLTLLAAMQNPLPEPVVPTESTPTSAPPQ